MHVKGKTINGQDPLALGCLEVLAQLNRHFATVNTGPSWLRMALASF